MSKAMNYETFLRSAFGYKEEGFLDRCGDPAGIANTDNFSDENIASVKAGTGYAMQILSNAIINKYSKDIDYDELDRLESFTKRVIDVTSLVEIDEAIHEFRDSVVNKYFEINEGKMMLKVVVEMSSTTLPLSM